MAIQTTCPQCGTSYRLPEDQQGKTVRCKNCSETFEVLEDEEIPMLEALDDEPEEEPSARIRQESSSPRRSRDEEDPPRRRRYEDDEDDEDFDDRARFRARRYAEEERPRARRYDEDEDDDFDDRRSGRGGGGGGAGIGILLGVIGGVMVLAVGGGAAAWYFLSIPAVAVPVPTPPVVAGDPGIVPPVVPQPEPGKQEIPAVPPGVVPPIGPAANKPSERPTTVAAALGILGDAQENFFRKHEALELLRKLPVEEARRAEVLKVMQRLSEEAAHKRDACLVLARWADKDTAPRLITLVEDHDSEVSKAAMEALARLDTSEGAEAVARQLDKFGRTAPASAALRKMSARNAEKHVVKLLHHRDDPVRNEARRLLEGYKTSREVLLEQTLSDLNDRDRKVRLSACEWLTKEKPNGEKEDKVAKTLEGLLLDMDRQIRVAGLKAMEVWGTKQNTRAICEALKDNQTRAAAVALLAKLQDEESIQPLGLQLNSPEREAIAKLLIQFGAKSEPIAQVQLKNGDPATRRTACLILAEIGTKESLGLLKKFATADKLNRDAAQEAIKKITERMK